MLGADVALMVLEACQIIILAAALAAASQASADDGVAESATCRQRADRVKLLRPVAGGACAVGFFVWIAKFSVVLWRYSHPPAVRERLHERLVEKLLMSWALNALQVGPLMALTIGLFLPLCLDDCLGDAKALRPLVLVAAVCFSSCHLLATVAHCTFTVQSSLSSTKKWLESDQDKVKAVRVYVRPQSADSPVSDSLSRHHVAPAPTVTEPAPACVRKGFADDADTGPAEPSVEYAADADVGSAAQVSDSPPSHHVALAPTVTEPAPACGREGLADDADTGPAEPSLEDAADAENASPRDAVPEAVRPDGEAPTNATLRLTASLMRSSWAPVRRAAALVRRVADTPAPPRSAQLTARSRALAVASVSLAPPRPRRPSALRVLGQKNGHVRERRQDSPVNMLQSAQSRRHQDVKVSPSAGGGAAEDVWGSTQTGGVVVAACGTRGQRKEITFEMDRISCQASDGDQGALGCGRGAPERGVRGDDAVASGRDGGVCGSHRVDDAIGPPLPPAGPMHARPRGESSGVAAEPNAPPLFRPRAAGAGGAPQSSTLLRFVSRRHSWKRSRPAPPPEQPPQDGEALFPRFR